MLFAYEFYEAAELLQFLVCLLIGSVSIAGFIAIVTGRWWPLILAPVFMVVAVGGILLLLGSAQS